MSSVSLCWLCQVKQNSDVITYQLGAWRLQIFTYQSERGGHLCNKTAIEVHYVKCGIHRFWSLTHPGKNSASVKFGHSFLGVKLFQTTLLNYYQFDNIILPFSSIIDISRLNFEFRQQLNSCITGLQTRQYYKYRNCTNNKYYYCYSWQHTCSLISLIQSKKGNGQLFHIFSSAYGIPCQNQWQLILQVRNSGLGQLNRAVVKTHSKTVLGLNQSFNWGPSVWSLHFHCLAVQISSVYFGFLQQSKNIHRRLTGDAKLSVGVNVSVNVVPLYVSAL